jgi:antitoxin (DNA-binding transcriptional repressor) of toxin-antitoxin stability system
MRFVTVRELRLKPAGVWQRLKTEHELVLTSKGRPIGILSDACGADVEATLRALRQAKAELAVAQMREHASRQGLDRLSMADIDKEIQAARRVRQR